MDRFAALSLHDKCSLAMTAAFIVACACVGYSAVRMASFAKGDLRPGGGDEPAAG